MSTIIRTGLFFEVIFDILCNFQNYEKKTALSNRFGWQIGMNATALQGVEIWIIWNRLTQQIIYSVYFKMYKFYL